MKEQQLKDLLGKGLPKIAIAALSSVYPIAFEAKVSPGSPAVLSAQVVGNQLIYTKNFQIYSFLTIPPDQIIRLGQTAFPKLSRADFPMQVVSANGEVLNIIMAKMAYLVGKIDDDDQVKTTPPIVINCSGTNGFHVPASDSIFLTLNSADISIQLVTIVQRV